MEREGGIMCEGEGRFYKLALVDEVMCSFCV